MNWFKKLFAQLSDEEERTIEQDYAKKPENKQKQLTAKVAYQYPTGKFRFPLIPDEGKKEQQPRQEKRKKSKVQQPSKPAEKTKPESIKVEQEKAATEEPVKKQEPTKKKSTPRAFEKVTNKNKQPFHPTEVVSPIYGYKSRPFPEKKEEYIPEIELLSRESISNEIAELSPLEGYSSANFEEITYKDESKVQAFSDELIEEENDSSGNIIEDENPITSLIDSAINEEQLVKEDEKEEIAEIEEITEIEDIKAFEEKEEIVEVNEVEEDATAYQQESAATLEYSEPIEKPKEKQNTEVNRTKETSSKQNIPFNVIMLKQDKRSLERKQQISSKEEVTQPYYRKPPITMLAIPPQHSQGDQDWVEAQKQLLDETLHHFRVGAKVVKATQGPSVTQFEVQPEPGVKVNKITNLSDDIKLSLSARDIRMEAPIPGKNTIGIEVPNRVSKPVFIREIIRHPSFIQNTSPLTVALGLDISGQPVVLDLQKMPHGLIAGATGSGKSVCVNSIIMSLLYKSTPDEVKLLLIDPKMVELTPYNHIPHLVSPVITDVKAATAALKWAVEEMERRYELFVHAGVRDIAKYNETAKKHNQETLPYMVIIIDELADLMMVAPSDVEEAICRIAQKARACGMHLLIATQRPSVDVITGLIKANVPTRIAFSVSSQVDSRTIIDIGGAERLLGRGDMLLLENGAPKPIRVQGNFVSDEEIERAVAHVRKEQKPNYLFEQSELLKDSTIQEEDELFIEACQYVIDQNGASTSSLQRRFRIGYNRAARLIDMMQAHGVISGPKGSKPRDVLVSEEELVSMQDSDF
ncbi:DNA translocase FtsK [Sutcliffiella horikoshii]|uniref:DNA translocase FtsK n=1 Tax=Sutcliffiella horikoshii TaxID=79883 RepID=UPI0038502B43